MRFKSGLLSLVIVGMMVVCARGAGVALDQMVVDGDVTIRHTSEGTEIFAKQGGKGGKLLTKAEYTTPLVITAVAKTDSTNIRLYYGEKGVLIFNWEVNGNELRHHNPHTGQQQGTPNQGAVERNTWATIKWTISEKACRVEVDGKLRASHPGNYAGLSGTVGIGTCYGATVTVKSLDISGGSRGPTPAGKASSAPAQLGAVDVTVSTSPPENKGVIATEKLDADAIERPEFLSKRRPLLKSLSSVTGMVVRVRDDGDELGFTSDIIGIVPAESRRGESAGVGIVAKVGPDMQTSFKEALRAVQLRYPYWEPGHIDISFGDKYSAYDGGSAGTAFAVLTLSMLEGLEIDPKFALTGDITVDWKVREVGGITAKLRGAALDKCLYAAIPAGNETAYADERLLYGDGVLTELQVFSIETLQDAVGLVRKDRNSQVAEAIKLFADVQAKVKAGKSALKDAAVHKTLERVLELAPNHLSAKYLLQVIDGTAPKTLSSAATLYQIVSILYPYNQLIGSGDAIDKGSLSMVTTMNAQKRMATLRPIADKDLQPMLTDAMAFIQAINAVAYGNGPVSTINERAQTVNARLTAISSDHGFLEKMVRDGY